MTIHTRLNAIASRLAATAPRHVPAAWFQQWQAENQVDVATLVDVASRNTLATFGDDADYQSVVRRIADHLDPLKGAL